MYTELVRTKELTSADRAAMFALLDLHFDGAKPDVFNTDLGLKNWVLLLRRVLGLGRGYLRLGSRHAISSKHSTRASGFTGY